MKNLKFARYFLCFSALAQIVVAQNELSPAPRVENRTHALQVTSVVSRENAFDVTVKNTSTKPIRTIAAKFGAGGVDYDYGDPLGPGLLPGSSTSFSVPVVRMHKKGTDPGPVDMSVPLDVPAVVFSDGTFDGDRVEAQRLFAARDGRKLYLEKIVATFESAAQQVEQSPRDALASLIEGVGGIPLTPVKESSLGFRQGSGGIRNTVKAQLEKLQSRSDLTDSQIRVQLKAMIEYYREVLNAL